MISFVWLFQEWRIAGRKKNVYLFLVELTTQSLSSKIQGIAGEIFRIYGENFEAKII
jgi:hypothetical protein